MKPATPPPIPDTACWSGSRMSRTEYARTWEARLAVVRAIGVVPWFTLTDLEADEAVRAEARSVGGGEAYLVELRAREAAEPGRVVAAERDAGRLWRIPL